MGKTETQRSYARRVTRNKRLAAGFMLLIAGFLPVSAWANEPSPAAAPELDQLLTLPKSFGVESDRRGGLTRTEWLARFAAADQALATAKEALAKSQKAMEDAAAGDAWKVAPPGMEASTEGTANFSLRQEIKRNRGEVARAEKHLRDLAIEANLAEVPEDWRHNSVSDAAPVPPASGASIQP